VIFRLGLQNQVGFGCGHLATESDHLKHDNLENAVGLLGFYDEMMAYLDASRMVAAAAGQENSTGYWSIWSISTTVLVSAAKSHSITYERLEEAFATEWRKFIPPCLDNTEVPLVLSGAVQAVKIKWPLQGILIAGKVFFAENG
jgi:myo-inositol 2-dehydrogenase / D-chiro-inositol 1-dehydrogenase